MRRLETLLTAAVVLASGLALHGCGSDQVAAPGFVTSGDCPREQAVVRRALERSTLRVDVDGDGRLDRVAVATDQSAGRRCRAYVAVRVQGGSTYSTHLFPGAVPPKLFRAGVAGLPDLGPDPGAEIVVDTASAADSLLAQMFTLTGDGFRRVHVPAFDDGTFIVEGAGVIYPQGAGCTRGGRLVLSGAKQTKDGTRYRVTRRTYQPRTERIRLVDPAVERATVPVDQLVERYPEFTHPHWGACTGPVRR